MITCILFLYVEAIVNYNDNGSLSPSLFHKYPNGDCSVKGIFNIFRGCDLQTMERRKNDSPALIEFSNKFMLFELKCIHDAFWKHS